eukprot:scaffold3595_cov109-Isochrysis_galbana.AAC.1
MMRQSSKIGVPRVCGSMSCMVPHERRAARPHEEGPPADARRLQPRTAAGAPYCKAAWEPPTRRRWLAELEKNRPAIVNDDGGVRDRAVSLPNGLRDWHEFFVHRANRPRGLDGAVLDDLAGSGLTIHGREPRESETSAEDKVVAVITREPSSTWPSGMAAEEPDTATAVPEGP